MPRAGRRSRRATPVSAEGGGPPLLFGYNPEERILAVHPVEGAKMRLTLRVDDSIVTRDEPFFPFCYLTDRSLLEGFPRKTWVKALEGPLPYQFLFAFEEWSSLREALRFITDRVNRVGAVRATGPSDIEQLFLVNDPVAQFLMQTGRTLFKGMEFRDLRRLQLDIETYSTSARRFSSAARPSDRIILIALTDSTGWELLIDGRKKSEKEMLRELVRVIVERDPDVLEGHNILGFDLPYIVTRCAQHDVPFAIGRDGTVPRMPEQRGPDVPPDFASPSIAGRHIIDTLLLVQNYDSSRRALESYGLKYAAQFFGVSSPDRVVIPGDRIAWHWDNDPEPLLKYAMDDARETGRLSAVLSGSSFYLAQMVPSSYGTITRQGAAAKVELMMVREYLRSRHSLPRPQPEMETAGGYTDIFVVGIPGPVVHADVESLYPSIMLREGILPSSDHLRVFPALLRELTERRLRAKSAMRASTDPGERARLDAIQSSFKILINSFYGYLGYQRGLFNDYPQAEAVTKAGREILHRMIAFIRSSGGTVIEADTDGIYFIPSPEIDSEEAERAFVSTLSADLPEGISVAHAGRYRRMLSYKKKNYALLGYDERITLRGSSLVNRSMEAFGRSYIAHCVDHLLHENIPGLHELYLAARSAIVEHRLDVRDFARVETLHDTIEDYRTGVEAGTRNKSAPYEVAILTRRNARPGTRVAYYITGTDANARGFENCKPVEEWDPNFPDENTAYYLKRLEEFSEKFQDFFEPKDFHAVFSAEDLFPFDPAGITPITRNLREEPPGSSDEAKQDQFGIWLDV